MVEDVDRVDAGRDVEDMRAGVAGGFAHMQQVALPVAGAVEELLAAGEAEAALGADPAGSDDVMAHGDHPRDGLVVIGQLEADFDVAAGGSPRR